ncbi:class I SAM-dependent methyltransferase [Pendulispora brunnea]|uniref:Class I SAM-dependent methyltransferase n=1 Tax=Pendulispora brunnea TaxID=2905690 RepID=A0ABZ2KKR6_9BACT
MSDDSVYVMGRSDAETERLRAQSMLFDPTTRRLFEQAGISTGMKVLDVGSGGGDVALLLADLVGPTGQVIGVDCHDAILEKARARTRQLGFDHVSFLQGDIRTIALDDDFDAVVGRLVLTYIPEPARWVRHLAAHVRPNGIVAFQDIEWSIGPVAFPPSSLLSRVWDWAPPAFERAGLETRMGLKLFRAFVDAGLPAPRMHVEAPAGGGTDWAGYEYIAAGLRSMLPVIERFELASAADVGIETFAARLRDETLAQHGVLMLPPFVSAWSRVAGSSL